MKKVLFVAMHRPDRSPSQRFRYEQYFSYLKENGYDYKLSYLLSESDDKVFYSKGHYLSKSFILFKSIFKRIGDFVGSSQYDIIFIQREAFMLGTSFFEKLFSKSKAKVIFDFDDSIWIPQITDTSANKNLIWMKRPQKTSEIIKFSDLIFAGNQYLADYARKYNNNVIIIPTTIDTDTYKPDHSNRNKGVICVGWSGSPTTIDHFNLAVPFLRKIKDKYGDKVRIKVMGDPNYVNSELNIQGIKWYSATEIQELNTFDIGIMPLQDDDWSRGKCGLKGLQYMALEIPTIMSPVGVNKEIIQDGVNGYLATTEDEWIAKLSNLIESKELRERLGKAGRVTVNNQYSVHSQKEKYLSAFNSLIK